MLPRRPDDSRRKPDHSGKKSTSDDRAEPQRKSVSLFQRYDPIRNVVPSETVRLDPPLNTRKKFVQDAPVGKLPSPDARRETRQEPALPDSRSQQPRPRFRRLTLKSDPGGEEEVELEPRKAKIENRRSEVIAEGAHQGLSPVKRVSSLLEELFPEEAKRKADEAQQNSERQVPRLPLDRTKPPTSEPAWTVPQQDTIPEGRDYLDEPDTTVLVLRNASKALTENDFRRVVPKGKHIEGWNLEQGDIEKIIPGRDPVTLDRMNYYYLIFVSPISASAYQTHVTKLHNLAQRHTSTSLTSPIPPPPGRHDDDDEDLHSLLQSYALIPPSQTIELRMLMKPLTPGVQSVVGLGGYRLLADKTRKPNQEVLLSFEGLQPTAFEIRDAFNKDGRDRGLLWFGNEASAVTKVEAPKKPVNEEEEEGSPEWGGDELVKVDQQRHNSNRLLANRWVIEFKSDAEAKRFVRSWHRRPFPSRLYTAGTSDTPPTINAELLW
ncbi:hypothetical protein LTR04_004191 [Oleoguttula sp. CCFEE 6159]|nr:hypothetical protein LTR04_004191 [Oleoguttula sp. CCFEE 6159]